MVIAVLVLLGVDLVLIVGLLVVIIGRRRWLKRQPDELDGAIRVISGEVPGLSSSWKRGFGRRVRNVLVWSRAPFLFRNAIVPVDEINDERAAAEGEVSHLGTVPTVFTVASGSATLEVAVRAGHSIRRPPTGRT